MNVIYILGTEKGACIDPPDHDGGERIRQKAPLTRWIGPAVDAIIHPAEDHRGDLPRLAILFGKDEDGAGARVLLNGNANRPLAELSLRHPVRERQLSTPESRLIFLAEPSPRSYRCGSRSIAARAPRKGEGREQRRHHQDGYRRPHP
jgi:hypothetical protein